jgi:predicted HTH domain antitoxin
MKKEEMVAARLPETLVADIKKIEGVEQTDRSTVLRKLLYKAVMEWKKEYAAKRYADGSITLERAAMEADLSVREMMDYLKQNRTVSQYDREDLEEDMKNFYKRIGKEKTD